MALKRTMLSSLAGSGTRTTKGPSKQLSPPQSILRWVSYFLTLIEAAPAHVLRAVALAQIAANESRKILDEHIMTKVTPVVEQQQVDLQ